MDSTYLTPHLIRRYTSFCHSQFESVGRTISRDRSRSVHRSGVRSSVRLHSGLCRRGNSPVVVERDIEVLDEPGRFGGKLDAMVCSVASPQFRRVVAEGVGSGARQPSSNPSGWRTRRSASPRDGDDTPVGANDLQSCGTPRLPAVIDPCLEDGCFRRVGT